MQHSTFYNNPSEFQLETAIQLNILNGLKLHEHTISEIDLSVAQFYLFKKTFQFIHLTKFPKFRIGLVTLIL